MTSTTSGTHVDGTDHCAAVGVSPRGTVEARDREDRLLMRFDPESRQATICLAGAELLLRVVDGVIEISSTAGIRIKSSVGVDLVGEVESSASGNRLAVTPHGVQLEASVLTATVTRTEFVGDTVTAAAKAVKVTWEKCERIVGRAFDYARHAYQRVDVLLHIRAGRIRTESKGLHLMQAEGVRIQAEADLRVQAASINLG
jgi:uncharacterized protein DUF3540